MLNQNNKEPSIFEIGDDIVHITCDYINSGKIVRITKNEMVIINSELKETYVIRLQETSKALTGTILPYNEKLMNTVNAHWDVIKTLQKRNDKVIELWKKGYSETYILNEV